MRRLSCECDGCLECEPTSNRVVEQFEQARVRRLVSHCHFEYPIGRACLGCAFLREQPTFNCLTNISPQIIHCFALRHASRQCRHFRPVTAFFCFMNEHLQCQERILPHWARERKTDRRVPGTPTPPARLSTP